jgi:DNA-binding transcriptional MerR regulator
MMRIGELAERTELSLQTIRHYDHVGLLPATSRTEGGFRVYSEEDLDRLMVIRRMKPLGFSVEEMAELLAVLDELLGSPEADRQQELASKLDAFRQAAYERREKMMQTLSRADEFIRTLSNY